MTFGSRPLRLAFVVQRYGPEINGGSEMQCRQLAERLSSQMEVEVLTTCAEDSYTWRNVYAAGQERIKGVLVRRFPVDRERNMSEFDRFSAQILGRPHTYFDEVRWMELQGPVSSRLLNHIDLFGRRYDLMVFMTYQYASTFVGLQIAPHKSILLPTAHDDSWIRLGIFRALFHLPRAFIFETPEEESLIRRIFKNEAIPGRVLGGGVDAQYLAELATAPPPLDIPSGAELKGDDPYIVFVGRVDPSKGCDQLFEYFLRFKSETGNPIKLVLVGKPTMVIPKHPDVISVGFTKDDPFPWIARAQALVLPSVMESLSLVVLESLGLGIPVLVNGNCDVLRGHCQRSNGGLYYRGYEEFAATLSVLLSQPGLRRGLGRQGQSYVQRTYDWRALESSYVSYLNWIAERNHQQERLSA
jgi:glycosyltransferase involved in cell wall biosynthesis